MISNCPDCGKTLHVGQHKFADGLFEVYYCKECGFRKEEKIKEEM
ncbi:zf-TFIIB domain-containing protein [Candidatus Woesearchaeota archaeon]|nr:zf-TFIIB domain-containing protein [Candidatus Woesearchaeota archaeon]